MTSLRKKLMFALFAAVAIVCFTVGALLVTPVYSSAETPVADVVLSAVEDFSYSDDAKTIIKGLSEDGQKKVENKNFGLQIPATVNEIGEQAFSGNRYLTVVRFITDSALTKIGQNAFFNCANLKSVVLPESNSLTIGARAFMSTALTKITIPEKVTNINTNAFADCKFVEQINYYATNCNPTSSNKLNPFSGLNAANNVKVFIGRESGAAITYIPSYLFSGTNIKEVTFNNVSLNMEAKFKDSIFADCTELTKVTFKSSAIQEIGAGVFSGCTALTEINLDALSANLEVIGNEAFSRCYSLRSVVIPSNVKRMGSNAFQFCTGLVEIDNRSKLDIRAGKTNISNNVDVTEAAAANVTVFGTGVKHVYNSTNSGEVSYIENANDFVFYKDETNTLALLLGYVGNQTKLTLPAGYKGSNYKINSRAFFNNTSLIEVNIPKQVSEIDEYAFYGCTALNKVTFETGILISYIGSYAFAKCGSLGAIQIPASVSTIDTFAFSECAKLKTVEFAGATLRTIDSNAFEKCSLLEVIKIPASVTAFGADAFKGCTNLSVVYLPTELQSAANYQVSGLFDSDTKNDRLLIATSADSYGVYNSYNTVWNNYGKLTYEVPVYLVYGNYGDCSENGEHHIVYKLFGLDHTYTKEEDGDNWFKSEQSLMPVQRGYSQSVWYDNSEFVNNPQIVTPEVLDRKLINDGDLVTHISLFAYYFDYTKLNFTLVDKGVITPNSDLQVPSAAIASWEFDGHSMTAAEYSERFIVTIAAYSPVAGTATLPEKIKHAGTYTLRVNLQPAKYGQWDAKVAREYIEKDYIVEPILITLDDEGNEMLDCINWGVVGGDLLSRDDKLYIYNGKTPYSTKQPDDSPLGTPEERNVTASSLMYTSAGWTIQLVVKTDYLTAVTGYEAVDDVSEVAKDGNGVTAKEAGIYTARARFISSNNYRFKYDKSGNNPYGITIEENKIAEGYEYIVTKVWYIVTADASELIAKEGGIYNPTTWIYGSDKVPGAPLLSSKITHGMEEQLITFTLENEAVFGVQETLFRYNYAQYNDVINSSMPVGNYVLTVYIANYTHGQEVIPGNGDKGTSWNITVQECNIDELLKKLAAEDKISRTDDLWGDLYTTQAVKKSFEVEYKTGIVQFASTANVPVLKLDESDIHNRLGIWKSKDYNDFYGKFIIEYNVETATGGLGGNQYFTAETYLNGPCNPGKYTVYFNVTANNYTNKIDISNETQRKQYYYTLFIKEYIDLSKIALGTVTYNNGNAVRFTDTDIYKFVYLDGSSMDEDSRKAFATFCRDGVRENYVNANDSVAVALMIRSNLSDYYGWKNGTVSVYGKDTPNEQTFAKLTFAIERADNRTTTPLYLKDWEWKTQTEFDIQWGTFYGNSQTDYTFSLQSKKDATDVYYYKPTGTQLGFDKADAGEYNLIATCAGGEGYNWKVLTETRPVTILQSRVVLETTPYIESWKYGDFKDIESRTPEYEFAQGFSALESSVTSYVTKLSDYNAYLEGKLEKDNMTVWPALADMLDAGGEIPAGSYVFVFELPDSGNYAAWTHEVYFSVLQVKNYWETTPTVHDWVYGDYTTRDTTIDCKPHFGNKSSVIYYYRLTGVSGWVTELPQDWFDKYGELSVGQYEFRAFLRGNENYEDLDSYMYFNVTPAKNSWTEDGIPGVNSWSQGNWKSTENALSAQAKYGTVVFEVYSSSDTERKNAYDIKDLNSLGVGSYVLVATVEGTNDYEKLVGEATFAVFEDSVGMTGIIATTVVFAVIAIGLAIGGVVLLILRNKKIEEEFRKMIKSELRRK